MFWGIACSAENQFEARQWQAVRRAERREAKPAAKANASCDLGERSVGQNMCCIPFRFGINLRLAPFLLPNLCNERAVKNRPNISDHGY
jgi:hypothetical protein